MTMAKIFIAGMITAAAAFSNVAVSGDSGIVRFEGMIVESGCNNFVNGAGAYVNCSNMSNDAVLEKMKKSKNHKVEGLTYVNPSELPVDYKTSSKVQVGNEVYKITHIKSETHPKLYEMEVTIN